MSFAVARQNPCSTLITFWDFSSANSVCKRYIWRRFASSIHRDSIAPGTFRRFHHCFVASSSNRHCTISTPFLNYFGRLWMQSIQCKNNHGSGDEDTDISVVFVLISLLYINSCIRKQFPLETSVLVIFNCGKKRINIFIKRFWSRAEI